MIISDKGIELIKRYEQCKLRAYICPAGVLTVGWGHTGNVRSGQVITAEQANDLLRRDIKVVQTCINTALPTLSQNRYDALCSFVFNVGCGAFLRSSLLKLIKANASDEVIKAEFKRWIHSKGKVLPGLVKRRTEEAQLFCNE